MPITRELALTIIKYLLSNPSFYFPFKIMCKSYVNDMDDNDFVEIVPKDDYDNLLKNLHYETFELWENLQDLNVETLQLMSKGFIEKIEDKSTIDKISALALEYRNSWKEDLWESEDSEEFGLNEYIGGKAEAYEECLELLKNSNKYYSKSN